MENVTYRTFPLSYITTWHDSRSRANIDINKYQTDLKY